MKKDKDKSLLPFNAPVDFDIKPQTVTISPSSKRWAANVALSMFVVFVASVYQIVYGDSTNTASPTTWAVNDTAINPVSVLHTDEWPNVDYLIPFTPEEYKSDKLPPPFNGSIAELSLFNTRMMFIKNTPCMSPASYTLPYNMLTLRGNTTYVNVKVRRPKHDGHPWSETKFVRYASLNSNATRLRVLYTRVEVEFIGGTVVPDEEAALCIQTYYHVD